MPDSTLQGGPEDLLRPALRRCLAITPQEFAQSCWGRSPLLSRAAELPGGLTGLTGLLTLDDVDELLSERGLRTPFLRIAQDGEVVDAARFAGSMGAGAGSRDQVRSGSVLALVAGGATVVLQGLHRLWPPLIDFGDQLSVDLGHPTQVNAYITPPGARGFDAHYDTHDVLVVQTAGRKRWVVHAPVVHLPGPADPWTDHRDEIAKAATEQPALDLVLEPGDVLYLPRGWLHSATAERETSAHLTIGIHPTTGVTAAGLAVDELRRLAAADPGLREALGVGVDLSEPSTAGSVAEVITRLHALLDEVDPDAVAERLRAAAWSQVRPAPVRPLAQAEAVHRLTLLDVLAVRPRLRTALRSEGGRPVLLAGQGRFVHAPGAAAALEAWLAAGRSVVGELAGLPPQDAVALARRLVLDGCAVLEPPVGSQIGVGSALSVVPDGPDVVEQTDGLLPDDEASTA